MRNEFYDYVNIAGIALLVPSKRAKQSNFTDMKLLFQHRLDVGQVAQYVFS